MTKWRMTRDVLRLVIVTTDTRTWDLDIGDVDPSHWFFSRRTGNSSNFWQKPVRGGITCANFHNRYVAARNYIFCESLFMRNTYIIYQCDSDITNPWIYIFSVKHFFITFSLIGLTDTTLEKKFLTVLNFLVIWSHKWCICNVCDLIFNKRWDTSCAFSFYVSKEQL